VPPPTIVAMIRETVLATVPDPDSPTPALLRLVVDADAARLSWAPPGAPETSCAVPARSLLLALRAAWDDRHAGSADLDAGPTRKPRPGPPNGRQPWTAELDTTLQDTWLNTPDTVPAFDVIGALAKDLGRSRNSIRARLARIGCDPDVAGRLLREEDGDGPP
jgi:hypothetical protein